MQAYHFFITKKSHIVFLLQFFYHLLFTPERVPAVDQGHLFAVVTEKQSILQSGITPACYCYIPVSEKHSVTGSTIGNAGTGKFFLIRQSQFPVFCASRQNHSLCFINLFFPLYLCHHFFHLAKISYTFHFPQGKIHTGIRCLPVQRGSKFIS